VLSRRVPSRIRRFTKIAKGFARASLGCLCLLSVGNAQDAGGAIPLAAQAEGAPIERVEVVLVRGSDNPARDQAALARLREAMQGLVGRGYSRAFIERQLATPRGRLGVGQISHRLASGRSPGTLALIVELDTAMPVDSTGTSKQGLLAGDARSFPVLYRSDRAFFTAIISGGLGAYSDSNPWFGNPALFTVGSPIARKRPGRQPGWTEGYTDLGLAGATQLGDTPFYAYGALTALTSWSVGQDIYRNDTRTWTDIERAYGGLLFVDPETGNSFNISAGRQNVTLNDGWLVHFVRGNANIGKRGGTYLGPRNANDFSVVADAKLGPWTAKAFWIDPDELPGIDSRASYLGANLRYTFRPGLSFDASYITVARSTGSLVAPGGVRLPREGLRTYAGHVRWERPFGADGFWLASEMAHQDHERFRMSAYAAYVLVGYQAAHLPWSPSLSYRFSYASGDNPNSASYNRFDPLLSTGLGNWLQGISFGKLTSNSNLSVHRLQFNVAPMPTLNIAFDWHILRAPERNNLGSNPALSTLTSSDIGQEFTLTGRWAINRKLYLQTIGSVAVPGKALRNIGARKSWSTLQASLYWSL
jgi:hypothetical protein